MGEPRPNGCPTGIVQRPAAETVDCSASAREQERNKSWSDFQSYAPKLVEPLKKSDEVNRLHAQGARLSPSLTQMYTLSDQAAAAHGTLASGVLGIVVPSEAREFKDSIYNALRVRETSMNRAKTAFNNPSVANLAAYEEAKKQVDATTLMTAGRMFALCSSLGRGTEDCQRVTGLNQ